MNVLHKDYSIDEPKVNEYEGIYFCFSERSFLVTFSPMDYYFITGTSRGIGRALAEKALEDDAARVTGFSRSSGLSHAHYTHTEVDLADIKALLPRLDTLFSEVDEAKRIVLVNNSGTLGDVKYLGDIDPPSMVTLFNLNVIAPALLMNAFLRQYRSVSAEKLIINVSSGAGKYPIDGWSGYCASKAALDMVSQVADLERKKRMSDVRIYALAPGVVDTDMQAHVRDTDVADFSTLEKFKNYHAKSALDDPSATAEKFFRLIRHPEQFEEVLQDVREFK